MTASVSCLLEPPTEIRSEILFSDLESLVVAQGKVPTGEPDRKGTVWCATGSQTESNRFAQFRMLMPGSAISSAGRRVWLHCRKFHRIRTRSGPEQPLGPVGDMDRVRGAGADAGGVAGVTVSA